MKNNPLITAILNGEIRKVRTIIKNNPELMDVRSSIGSLPYEIAVNKGLANQQTALLRANAAGSEKFKDYDQLLTHYISDISHDYGCASWLGGIEFALWKIVFENQSIKEDVFGFNKIDEEIKRDLRFLSRKCAGWAMWSEEEGDSIVIPLAIWKEVLESPNQKNTDNAP